VYRENCTTGGNNLKSISFDGQGNGTFPLGSGVLTFNAVAVTQILNGQVQPDMSTGKLLAFSAYVIRAPMAAMPTSSSSTWPTARPT
jgi:hypothetical protein